MVILKKKNLYLSVFIILASFMITNFISFENIRKFDNYESFQNNKHPMLKSSVENAWSEANIILKNFKNTKNFFSYQKMNEDEFLPPKILSIFYIIYGDEMYVNNFVKTKNGKLFYLIIKNFFYYILVFFLFLKLSKNLDSRSSIIIITYLSILPDITQYHSSFWNENITFIIQILILILVLNFHKSIKKNFFLGLITSLLFLTGQEYTFYFFIFIIYYFFIKFYYRERILLYLSSYLTGYFIIVLLVFFLSSLKTQDKKENNVEILYGLKSALYIYIVPEILSKKYKIDNFDAKNIMLDDAKKWAKQNNINYDLSSDFLLKIINKNSSDQIKYNNYILKYALEKTAFNLHYAISSYAKGCMHMGLLNPTFVSNFHKFSSYEEMLSSDDHKKIIKYRIVYSIIFYLVILIGFVKSTKLLKPELIFLIFLLSIYNFLILGWLGLSRYFAPVLIYLSLFFGLAFKK